MTFNSDLAVQIVEGGDRDVARFFAGREAEIASFETALRVAEAKRQTVFRVFQGAPGAGKTSLLHHLETLRRHDRRFLFVAVRDEHLTSRADLVGQVAEAAARRPAPAAGHARNLGGKAKALLAKYRRPIGGRRCGAQSASAALGKWQQTHVLRTDVTVVMLFDEAHRANPQQLRVFRGLHKGGLQDDVRSVLVLGGLSHTAQTLSSGGISRLDADAVVDVGALAHEDCVQSTAAMLEALNPDGSVQQRQVLAEQVAQFSYGWPQHLNRAQSAMCDELLRSDGAIERMDLHRVEQSADEARGRYYEGRLQTSVLDRSPSLAYRVISAVGSGRVAELDDLEAICQEQIDARGRPYGASAAAVATALIEKGVVCATRDQGYVVPIPSMVRWAEEQV